MPGLPSTTYKVVCDDDVTRRRHIHIPWGEDRGTCCWPAILHNRWCCTAHAVIKQLIRTPWSSNNGRPFFFLDRETPCHRRSAQGPSHPCRHTCKQPIRARHTQPIRTRRAQPIRTRCTHPATYPAIQVVGPIRISHTSNFIGAHGGESAVNYANNLQRPGDAAVCGTLGHASLSSCEHVWLAPLQAFPAASGSCTPSEEFAKSC